MKWFKDRFEAFPDPVDNWVVWDHGEDDFAECEGQILSCLSQSRAHAFCALLNKLLSRPDRLT
jgi:hypothetical protein